MENKDWKQVETIFHTALKLGGEERVLYLSQTCSGNAALLSEVESLISAFESESQFLEEPAFSLGLNVIGRNDDKDLTGEKIGFYEIKEKLGGGGMGDVYLAEDTRLNRKVALKFLKDMFADDKWAKRQFMKEAQAVAMLEHPNICHVHSIEEIGEHNFIVMQYIEGATLAQFVSEQQPSLEKILSIAHQMISAVAAAHSHGIIHRDIKPGNIMITPEGLVKVLDFGLAKVIEQKQKAGRAEENISQISQNGLILGTVSYMSPEQLRAEKLDYRSDIFSVGIVLHEMLGKQNPFNRKSQAETIAAILSEEPSGLKETALQIPETLDFIVQKCLNKNKEKRFQSAAEILVELDKAESANVAKPISKRDQNYFVRAILVAFVLLVGLAVIFFYPGKSQQKTLAVLPISFENPPPEKEYLADGLTQSIVDKLSDLSDLKVRNEYSVASFKGRTAEPRAVGKELNAEVVFVGTIQKRGEELFLVAKLIRTSDGSLMDTYESGIEEANLIDLQENISARIVSGIKSSLTDDDKNKFAKKDTENPEAKRSYIRGRFFLERQQGEDLQNAERYFKEATNLDPAYAKAWTGLADTYTLMNVPGQKGAIPPDEAVKLARWAATKAIEIDDTLCEPYVSLGMIKLRYEWDWDGAESYFRAAITRNPEFPQAHLGLSNLLIIKRDYAQSIEEAKKAKEFSPFSALPYLSLARTYYFERNYEQMDRIISEGLGNFPDHKRLTYFRGLQYLQTNRLPEAAEIFEKIYAEDIIYGAAPLGLIYAKTGRNNEAMKILVTLEELSKDKNQDYVSSQEKAIIYTGLGEFDKAFENLMKACDEKFPPLPFAVTEPIFDEIKTDPRFADVQKCVNL